MLKHIQDAKLFLVCSIFCWFENANVSAVFLLQWIGGLSLCLQEEGTGSYPAWGDEVTINILIAEIAQEYSVDVTSSIHICTFDTAAGLRSCNET